MFVLVQKILNIYHSRYTLLWMLNDHIIPFACGSEAKQNLICGGRDSSKLCKVEVQTLGLFGKRDPNKDLAMGTWFG